MNPTEARPMDEVRSILRKGRASLLDRWERQLRASADAGFGLDPLTAEVLPRLLDAADRALERKFRPVEGDGAQVTARKSAMQSSLLGDFLFDAAIEALPQLTCEQQRELSDALAHAAVEVLVLRAVEREKSTRRRELQRFTRVAHELRDAMTGAQLAFDLLRSRKAIPDSQTARALETSLRKLRDGLEDAALDELLCAGGLRQTRVRLGPVLADCAAAAGELGATGKRVQVELAPTRVAVLGDPRVVRPAVRGLLRAAIELARPDSMIRFEAAASSKARSRVVVHVSRSRQGSAPQLALVRKAARAQGGAVAVKPRGSSRCTLTLELPSST